MSDQPTLHQFAFSHFNEKARWALDYKGIAYKPNSVLPGFHTEGIVQLSGGPTTTPLLEDGASAISGSAAIVEHLEKRAPNPPLFPSDAKERQQVVEWIEWLDDEVGPAVRLALFHEILTDPDYAGRLFTTGQSASNAEPYRLAFPRLIPVLRERMSIDDESAKAARETIHAALRRIDEATSGTGYLVGNSFSAADLTAAALLYPVFIPDELGFEMPQVASEAMDGWRARWIDAPGLSYARRIWAEHR